MSFNLHVVELMNDATNVDVSADYCSVMRFRLASVHLIVYVRAIELGSECGKFNSTKSHVSVEKVQVSIKMIIKPFGNIDMRKYSKNDSNMSTIKK